MRNALYGAVKISKQSRFHSVHKSELISPHTFSFNWQFRTAQLEPCVDLSESWLCQRVLPIPRILLIVKSPKYRNYFCGSEGCIQVPSSSAAFLLMSVCTLLSLLLSMFQRGAPWARQTSRCGALIHSTKEKIKILRLKNSQNIFRGIYTRHSFKFCSKTTVICFGTNALLAGAHDVWCTNIVIRRKLLACVNSSWFYVCELDTFRLLELFFFS